MMTSHCSSSYIVSTTICIYLCFFLMTLSLLINETVSVEPDTPQTNTLLEPGLNVFIPDRVCSLVQLHPLHTYYISKILNILHPVPYFLLQTEIMANCRSQFLFDHIDKK